MKIAQPLTSSSSGPTQFFPGKIYRSRHKYWASVLHNCILVKSDLQSIFPPEFKISQFLGWIKSPSHQHQSVCQESRWFWKYLKLVVQLPDSTWKWMENPAAILLNSSSWRCGPTHSVRSMFTFLGEIWLQSWVWGSNGVWASMPPALTSESIWLLLSHHRYYFHHPTPCTCVQQGCLGTLVAPKHESSCMGLWATHVCLLCLLVFMSIC